MIKAKELKDTDLIKCFNENGEAMVIAFGDLKKGLKPVKKPEKKKEPEKKPDVDVDSKK